ncbi:hypothetical protein [Gordonia sihwensis]|uniref:hypothetical protein n=1 Tax=Gordonia sihwensis TaxID=173559 RepID=UPI003D965AF6
MKKAMVTRNAWVPAELLAKAKAKAKAEGYPLGAIVRIALRDYAAEPVPVPREEHRRGSLRQFSYLTPGELHEQVKAAASDNGTTVAEVCRRGLALYVENPRGDHRAAGPGA